MNDVEALEQLAAEAYDGGAITEVIRPAAVLPDQAAHAVVMALAGQDVAAGGLWQSTPTLWQRYDRPWSDPAGDPGEAMLIGTMQVAYGTPTRHEITIYRATITPVGARAGWTVEGLCDEALGYGGYTLATCPRAALTAPPRPFRFPGRSPG